MKQQRIKFRIRKDGVVEEQTEGCTGPVCEVLTKDVNAKLGELQYIEHKPEYYQTQSDVENVTLHTHQD